MKIKFLSVLASMILIMSAQAQEKKDEKKEVKDVKKTEEKGKDAGGKKAPASVYYEIALEDFESTSYTDGNLHFITVKDNQEGGIKIRDEFPAPTGGSKKYLGVKVKGRTGDFFTVTPAKELLIDKMCDSINMWAYGKNFTGTLSIFIEDANKNAHRLVLGKVNFLGWRKLSVKVPKSVVQEDEFLNQKRTIKITKIVYEPGNPRGEQPKWQFFYIDDITALVREKYSDRQSDDW